MLNGSVKLLPRLLLCSGMKVAVCFAAVCLVLATAHPLVKNPYRPCEIDTSCDDSSYDLQNLKITISPDPPQENENLTITVSGTFTKEISGGSVKVVINFNDSGPILDQSYDICDDVAPTIHKQCPLHAGPISASVSTPIPAYIAKGKYSISINGTDQDGGKLLCGHVTCEI